MNLNQTILKDHVVVVVGNVEKVCCTKLQLTTILPSSKQNKKSLQNKIRLNFVLMHRDKLEMKKKKVKKISLYYVCIYIFRNELSLFDLMTKCYNKKFSL